MNNRVCTSFVKIPFSLILLISSVVVGQYYDFKTKWSHDLMGSVYMKNMKYLLSINRFSTNRFLAISFLLFSFTTAQTITNVHARQEGLEIIISYDMEGELQGKKEIMLGVSTDGGRNYETIQDAEGDIGKNVKSGRGKEIYFFANDALGGKNAKFKVEAKPPPPPPGMVYIQGGTFQMGSKKGDSDEKPIHTVTVSGFFMDKTEVTQAQYRKVMGKNPSRFSGCDDCPVESVIWHDANEYAKRVGKRLPTEAEWEYAARGGNKTNGYKYAGGNSIGNVAWYNGNSGSKTHPVAQKQPNELGLYDMSGNVWEWCSDWYDSKYYKSSPKHNPQGPNAGPSRVLRGGSWFNVDVSCRVANRSRNDPGNRYNSSGFRLVLSPD